MVFCPNCGYENNDSAKFCKNCGNSLKAKRPIKDDYVATGHDPTARVDNSGFNSSNNNNEKSDNKNLIIICLTVVICAVLIAGALVLFSSNNSNNNDIDALSDSSVSNDSNAVDNVEENSADNEPKATESTVETAKPSMEILSGTLATNSPSDKTHCTVYVGSEHAGENVKISVLYSNGGVALNQGKIVPKTVSGSGYIEVPTANVLDAYPDNAYITIYDSSGNILDTQEVNMSPEVGTQTF